MEQTTLDRPTERMERRLARLERDNRRLKLGGGVLVVALTLLGLMGAGRPDVRHVEAESFIVKDATGRVRAVLGTTDPYSAPGLVMYDQEGHANVLLHLTGDGDPGLWLYEHDKVRSTLNAVGDRVHLQLYDNEGRQRAVLMVRPNGQPSIELLDQDENVRSSLR
jgi:hypothetical protein